MLLALALLIRGAAVDGSTLYTWGGAVHAWQLPQLTRRVIAEGEFGEGGCIADVNRDGRRDLVLQRGTPLGKLIWLEAPHWREHPIDDEIQMHDCVDTEILGRKGVLMTQRHMQVRFYEHGGAMREIYSFYTASNQTGLCVADIDEDSRLDIVSGNYWIRSPEEFELPWRLFAINTHSRTPESAMSRCAFLRAPDTLIIAQGHMREARLMLFERPADPRIEWPETKVNAEPLDRPHALAVAGGRIFVADASRLLEFTVDGRSRVLARAADHVALFYWRNRLLAITRTGAKLYRPPRR